MPLQRTLEGLCRKSLTDTVDQWMTSGSNCVPVPYRPALERTAEVIDGFESSLGMELLATVDWLLAEQNYPATIADVKQGLADWPGGRAASNRKLAIFADRLLGLAVEHLALIPNPNKDESVIHE